MEYSAFSKELKELTNKINIDLNEKQINMFYLYMNTLIDWNNKINLTAITEPHDIIVKHFVDSLTISNFIDNNKSIIDVGTGAGFPGIPCAIFKTDDNILLLDALNKRISFLNEVISSLNIENVETIHGRAEEVAKQKQYREQFDYATSRAVAPLNVLLEYLLPFVKVGGYCICMKGSNIEEEIKEATACLNKLGGCIEKVEHFLLPNTDNERNIVIIKKIKQTPSIYPRKAGTPSRNPIIS